MENQLKCKCRVCGKEYELLEALIEENFFTIETDYCENCVKNVLCISLSKFKYEHNILGKIKHIGLYGDTIGVEIYAHINTKKENV